MKLLCLVVTAVLILDVEGIVFNINRGGQQPRSLYSPYQYHTRNSRRYFTNLFRHHPSPHYGRRGTSRWPRYRPEWHLSNFDRSPLIVQPFTVKHRKHPIPGANHIANFRPSLPKITILPPKVHPAPYISPRRLTTHQRNPFYKLFQHSTCPWTGTTRKPFTHKAIRTTLDKLDDRYTLKRLTQCSIEYQQSCSMSGCTTINTIDVVFYIAPPDDCDWKDECKCLPKKGAASIQCKAHGVLTGEQKTWDDFNWKCVGIDQEASKPEEETTTTTTTTPTTTTTTTTTTTLPTTTTATTTTSPTTTTATTAATSPTTTEKTIDLVEDIEKEGSGQEEEEGSGGVEIEVIPELTIVAFPGAAPARKKQDEGIDREVLEDEELLAFSLP